AWRNTRCRAPSLSSRPQVALRRQQAQEEELGISHPVPLPSATELFVKKEGSGGSSCLLWESGSPPHAAGTAATAAGTPSGKALREARATAPWRGLV
uniref:Uncharacterized protein n=1 Tax=Dromaius novaehollandiae TaxID=8790 RepID=A0A8C4JHW1_DRONO